MISDRTRLARELHDGIAQDLVAIGYSLDLLLANPETTVETRPQIRALRFTVSDLIDKVRREIFLLRQPTSLPLAERIRNAANDHCKDIELQLSLDEVPLDFDSELSYEIERIVQEILRNVALHSHADNVFISLENKGTTIQLRIVDNGIGGATITDGHYGIQSILDRTSTINGTLEIGSDASGTNVLLQIPITKNPHDQF